MSAACLCWPLKVWWCSFVSNFAASALQVDLALNQSCRQCGVYDALCILLSEYESLSQNLQSRQLRNALAHHLTACFPAGCVLVPGETLPLRIGPPLAAHSSLRSAAIEQALAAPPPLSRLIAVVRLEETTFPR